MKIFGFEINWNSGRQDQTTLIRSVTPDTTPISKIPSIKIKSLSYAQQFAQGRKNFQAAEYDLSEIGKVEDTDGFVRQAFKKKEGLMFKEGLGVQGANKKTVRYYKTRMAQMAQATNIPTILLLKRISRSLIRTSNAFLVKVRDLKPSGGRMRTTADGKELKPIAGYFPAAPETMRVDLNANTGKIQGWRQELPNGSRRDYKPEDVIHFAIDKREGFFFGTPTLVPVIDDIRALRQIEENIELLLYQCLFPLFHYKVGTETAPAGYTEDGDKEIELVEEQIQLMPSEGVIVTPERHEITAIGSEGRAIRAEGYLTHFKKRVFAGLGVSSVDMGDGDTTNRATAQTLSRAIIDAVKAIQDDLEAQWDQFVVTELLLESSFGDDVLEEENMVHLQFAEIDIQNKMELEKHALELFKDNGITYDELRQELSKEPIPIPEDPHDQDPDKYPEWHKTHWKLFGEITALINAVDEPWSVAAQMVANARSAGITGEQQAGAQKQKEDDEKRAAEEDRKTKVAVVKARPAPSSISKKDNYLSTSFKDLESDSADRLLVNVERRGTLDPEYLLSLARVWASDATEKVHSLAVSEMIRGFNDQSNMQAANAEILLSVGRGILLDRIGYRLNKLVENTVSLISRRVDQNLGGATLAGAGSDAVHELHVAFDSVRYRTDFIWDVEIRKSYNFGRVLGMRHLDEYGFELVAHSDACERCSVADGRVITAINASIDDVPPLHPHSRMKMKIVREHPGDRIVTDAQTETAVPMREEGVTAPVQDTPSIAAKTAVCNECGTTATWQPKSGNFFCAKCQSAFTKPKKVKKK